MLAYIMKGTKLKGEYYISHLLVIVTHCYYYFNTMSMAVCIIADLFKEKVVIMRRQPHITSCVPCHFLQISVSALLLWWQTKVAVALLLKPHCILFIN